MIMIIIITYSEKEQLDTNFVDRKKKITHLMYMDDIKLFAKNEKKKMETLIHAVRIYSQDIRMEFGIEKCVMLVMKSGKRHLTREMELPNQDKIRTLGENDINKY